MTYSIVARDADTGQLGVAVQSHFFGVGRLVTWAEAGVGAVVTQSIPDIAHGIDGLEALRAGQDAEAVARSFVTDEPITAMRQFAVVDAAGGIGVHTGAGCVGFAGHRTSNGVSAQANMMAKATVWDAMVDTFEASKGDLAHRLLAALHAAEGEGGDLRGKQSAALLVVSGERSERPWDERLVDLRVDDHAAPLAELDRLLECNGAFTRVAGVLFSGIIFQPKLEPDAPELVGALEQLALAQQAQPHNYEPTFWRALLLTKSGQLDAARYELSLATDHHAGWKEFLTRLPASGLLDPADPLLESVAQRA